MRGIMKKCSTNRSSRILTLGLRAILPTVLAFSLACKHSPFTPEAEKNDPKKDVADGHEPSSTNEPSGFTPIANREFKALTEDHWIYGGDGNAVKFVDDQTAPQSKPSVGDITIPAGFSSGASPVNFERTIRDSDHLYANYWFKVSEKWEYN